MRTHSHDAEESALRPRAARLDTAPPSAAARAAATGHREVLDPAGVLGLQRAAGNAGVGAALAEERSPVHEVIGSGGGSPLPPDVQAEMQTRLGHDFGDVRVHTDGRAHESARSVNAHAYTVGSNVVFQRDAYDPTSTAGKTMLAHELTHVVQQRSGPVDGTPTGGGIRVSDPGDRFEREAAANAERVMSVPAPAAAPAVSPGAAAVQRAEEDEDVAAGSAQGTSVQRAEEPEEETAQGAFVQRAEAPEEQEQAD
ncbi:DUF4157 domain-containing protein [Nakamurella deserti]|uniref:eCIS core domain-containing protein n=1 Tax=Nakamurella deserti TaxID=2164074 RepID=UPI000DBE97C3|nr:DUF4157 domain-containing protein [Nakamurella deserti]